MGARKKVLFEKCPLCRKGIIEMATRSALIGGGVSIDPCPLCGAIFSPRGAGRFRLGYCDPRKIASIRGKSYPRSVCYDCIPFAECWIGRTLSKSEWHMLSEGQVIDAWAGYEDTNREFEESILSASPSEPDVAPLGEDEVVQHASVVNLSEVTIPGDERDEAQLLLTSRRLVIVHQSFAFDIRLADIEKVEPSFPGFVITAKGVGFPLYCFPVPGDPVYHAIVGALKRIH